ncbi:hypothetical protein CC86DRAFT_367901 [Ophiobolus disseminans]|uniref:CoA-dependent acyltransferase n=1 Tax=Ophiobolus disseminans TaxID=1469910 RepID=A0A6A7A9R3_9PLEO|nr:hypothetical protein CC86DRAFT_367901 [Ophiobolus disseminans]
MATSSRYPCLNWRESTIGCWQREIDETERFYTYLAKSYEGTERMFFAITGLVSLHISLSEQLSLPETSQLVERALREAWLRLRYDHPTIASYVAYDVFEGRWIKTYNAFTQGFVNDQTEEWLQATFVPITSTLSGQEWCNSDPLAPKFPTLFIITSPDPVGTGRTLRYDLVIRSPHDIMDGIGTLQLLDNLLRHAAQAFEIPNSWSPPPPGSECRNLSPPLRIAAAIPPILTLDQQDCLQRIIARNEPLRRDIEVLTMPFKRGKMVPGKHQRIAHELSVFDTARVLEECKRHDATITHVYHAAVAITVRDKQVRGPTSRQARYINYALINERSKCIEDYGSAKHAAAVYHSVSGDALALDVTIPAAKQDERNQEQDREEFRTLTKLVKQFYHEVRDSPDNLALAPSFWSMATPHLTNPASAPHETPIPSPNEAPSVSISSMGVVEKIVAPQHGPFKIDDAWVTGEELGTGLGIFLGTWEGILRLSAAYNDAWHDKEEVGAFLDRLQEVVWNGLGLND